MMDLTEAMVPFIAERVVGTTRVEYQGQTLDLADRMAAQARCATRSGPSAAGDRHPRGPDLAVPARGGSRSAGLPVWAMPRPGESSSTICSASTSSRSLIQPTFITHYPGRALAAREAVAPNDPRAGRALRVLHRRHGGRQRVQRAQRSGSISASASRRRSTAKAEGDDEAHPLDEDYMHAPWSTGCRRREGSESASIGSSWYPDRRAQPARGHLVPAHATGGRGVASSRMDADLSALSAARREPRARVHRRPVAAGGFNAVALSSSDRLRGGRARSLRARWRWKSILGSLSGRWRSSVLAGSSYRSSRGRSSSAAAARGASATRVREFVVSRVRPWLRRRNLAACIMWARRAHGSRPARLGTVSARDRAGLSRWGWSFGASGVALLAIAACPSDHAVARRCCGGVVWLRTNGVPAGARILGCPGPWRSGSRAARRSRESRRGAVRSDLGADRRPWLQGGACADPRASWSSGCCRSPPRARRACGTAVEWFIAVRYLVAKRRQVFISAITAICVVGIAAGVWLIITVCR